MGAEGGDGKELELPILTFNGSLLTESSSARENPLDRGRTGSSHQFHDIVCGPSSKMGQGDIISW